MCNIGMLSVFFGSVQRVQNLSHLQSISHLRKLKNALLAKWSFKQLTFCRYVTEWLGREERRKYQRRQHQFQNEEKKEMQKYSRKQHQFEKEEKKKTEKCWRQHPFNKEAEKERQEYHRQQRCFEKEGTRGRRRWHRQQFLWWHGHWGWSRGLVLVSIFSFYFTFESVLMLRCWCSFSVAFSLMQPVKVWWCVWTVVANSVFILKASTMGLLFLIMSLP